MSTDTATALARSIIQANRYLTLATADQDGLPWASPVWFATVDLQGEYRVARDWRLQARIANLLDEQYETVAYYNQPGRAVYITLRYAGR